MKSCTVLGSYIGLSDQEKSLLKEVNLKWKLTDKKELLLVAGNHWGRESQTEKEASAKVWK